jgi:hypothetical protein
LSTPDHYLYIALAIIMVFLLISLSAWFERRHDGSPEE